MTFNLKNSLLLPALSGISFAAGGVLVWLLLEKSADALGAPSSQPRTDGLFVALLFLQIGYFVASVPFLSRAGRQCLESLAGQLREDTPGLRDIRARFGEGRISGLRWAALPGLLLAAASQEIQFARLSSFIDAPRWALGELWTVLAAWVTWSLAFWLIVRVLLDVNAIRRLGRDYVVIDLIRIQPLVAFSRYGLQLAGLIVGIIALWAISAVVLAAFLSPGGPATSNEIVILMFVIYLALTMGAFTYPQLGIRENMSAHKHLAAEQITRQLPHVHEEFPPQQGNAEQLAALLAVRSHIQTLPDWPIGQHTRIRLALYLFIPLLSWVAAAVVEELLSMFWF